MKTGDRVICIKATYTGGSYPPPLIKGREYIIYDYHKCGCGHTSVDVGLIAPPETTGMFCHKCGTEYADNSPSHWCALSRFVKVKEQYKTIHMDIEIEEPNLN